MGSDDVRSEYRVNKNNHSKEECLERMSDECRMRPLRFGRNSLGSREFLPSETALNQAAFAAVFFHSIILAVN